MTVTRTATGFAVVTDTVMTDHRLQQNARMRLDGQTLVADLRPGEICLAPFRVVLGPVSYAAVQALAVGETFDSRQPVDDDDAPPPRYQGGPYFVTDADRPVRRRQVRR